jgi:hypothetical protein
MKYTLADCIEKINQVLNYPSVDYSDISHFFDQAVSELNTELHIGLRPISEIYKNSGFKLESLEDFIFLEKAPVGADKNIPKDTDKGFDKSKAYVYLSLVHDNAPVGTYNDSDVYKIFYRHNLNEDFKETYTLYGVYAEYYDNPETGVKEISKQLYQTLIIGGYAYWQAYEFVPDVEVNLTDYLAYDWIVLFLIPYVCFKFSVRNGDSGALYAEEFQQGFQQLNKSYEVPSFSILSEQAGKKAYQQDVEENLSNLKIYIPTRAIYEDMKVSRVIQAKYGGSMYDPGGWDI